MLTLNRINKILPDGIELVKGVGYFYFVGECFKCNQSTSVYVFRLNDLSEQEWLSELNSLLNS